MFSLKGKGIFTARNEVCQGYVFTRVCHSVHGGGSASVHAAIPPPPPGPGTPLEQIPSPLGTRRPPRADAPRDQAPPCAVHAGRYGQQAGRMHPTGIQSCHIERLRSCLRSYKEQAALFPVKPFTRGVDAK